MMVGSSGPSAAPVRRLFGEHPQEGRIRRRILIAGAASLLAWVLLQWVSPPARISWSDAMRDAAGEMARGLQVTGAYCRGVGIAMDPSLDPDGTCLVGPAVSPLFTSLGSLEAKRTSLTPDLAGLLVYLLETAGVSAGDTVAVGASGSFPGLLLATLAAIRVLEAQPITILSLGASSYGATRPEFHILELHEVLQRADVVSAPPAAVSFGGEGDLGPELSPELATSLRRATAEAGLPLLFETELRVNVARRMEIYGRPAAFVNVGGAEANLGLSPVILDLPPGLILPARLSRASRPHISEGPEAGPGAGHLPRGILLPPPDQRGLVFEMLAQGVPVIHLLHLRGLALRYGLPWDPVPLPEPASTSLRDVEARGGLPFWLMTTAYLGILCVLFLPWGGEPRAPFEEPPTPSA